MIDDMRKGFELPVPAAADVGEVSVGLNRKGVVADDDGDSLDCGVGAVEVGAMPGELRAAAVLAVGKETGGSLSPK